jgi:hypothetical protein
LKGGSKLLDDFGVLQKLELFSNKLKGTILCEHLLLAYEASVIE